MDWSKWPVKPHPAATQAATTNAAAAVKPSIGASLSGTSAIPLSPRSPPQPQPTTPRRIDGSGAGRSPVNTTTSTAPPPVTVIVPSHLPRPEHTPTQSAWAAFSASSGPGSHATSHVVPGARSASPVSRTVVPTAEPFPPPPPPYHRPVVLPGAPHVEEGVLGPLDASTVAHQYVDQFGRILGAHLASSPSSSSGSNLFDGDRGGRDAERAIEIEEEEDDEGWRRREETQHMPRARGSSRGGDTSSAEDMTLGARYVLSSGESHLPESGSETPPRMPDPSMLAASRHKDGFPSTTGPGIPRRTWPGSLANDMSAPQDSMPSSSQVPAQQPRHTLWSSTTQLYSDRRQHPTANPYSNLNHSGRHSTRITGGGVEDHLGRGTLLSAIADIESIVGVLAQQKEVQQREAALRRARRRRVATTGTLSSRRQSTSTLSSGTVEDRTSGGRGEGHVNTATSSSRGLGHANSHSGTTTTTITNTSGGSSASFQKSVLGELSPAATAAVATTASASASGVGTAGASRMSLRTHTNTYPNSVSASRTVSEGVLGAHGLDHSEASIRPGDRPSILPPQPPPMPPMPARAPPSSYEAHEERADLSEGDGALPVTDYFTSHFRAIQNQRSSDMLNARLRSLLLTTERIAQRCRMNLDLCVSVQVREAAADFTARGSLTSVSCANHTEDGEEEGVEDEEEEGVYGVQGVGLPARTRTSPRRMVTSDGCEADEEEEIDEEDDEEEDEEGATAEDGERDGRDGAQGHFVPCRARSARHHDSHSFYDKRLPQLRQAPAGGGRRRSSAGGDDMLSTWGAGTTPTTPSTSGSIRAPPPPHRRDTAVGTTIAAPQPSSSLADPSNHDGTTGHADPSSSSPLRQEQHPPALPQKRQSSSTHDHASLRSRSAPPPPPPPPSTAPGVLGRELSSDSYGHESSSHQPYTTTSNSQSNSHSTSEGATASAVHPPHHQHLHHLSHSSSHPMRQQEGSFAAAGGVGTPPVPRALRSGIPPAPPIPSPQNSFSRDASSRNQSSSMSTSRQSGSGSSGGAAGLPARRHAGHDRAASSSPPARPIVTAAEGHHSNSASGSGSGGSGSGYGHVPFHHPSPQQQLQTYTLPSSLRQGSHPQGIYLPATSHSASGQASSFSSSQSQSRGFLGGAFYSDDNTSMSAASSHLERVPYARDVRPSPPLAPGAVGWAAAMSGGGREAHGDHAHGEETEAAAGNTSSTRTVTSALPSAIYTPLNAVGPPPATASRSSSTPMSPQEGSGASGPAAGAAPSDVSPSQASVAAKPPTPRLPDRKSERYELLRLGYQSTADKAAFPILPERRHGGVRGADSGGVGGGVVDEDEDDDEKDDTLSISAAPGYSSRRGFTLEESLTAAVASLRREQQQRDSEEPTPAAAAAAAAALTSSSVLGAGRLGGDVPPRPPQRRFSRDDLPPLAASSEGLLTISGRQPDGFFTTSGVAATAASSVLGSPFEKPPLAPPLPPPPPVSATPPPPPPPAPGQESPPATQEKTGTASVPEQLSPQQLPSSSPASPDADAELGKTLIDTPHTREVTALPSEWNDGGSNSTKEGAEQNPVPSQEDSTRDPTTAATAAAAEADPHASSRTETTVKRSRGGSCSSSDSSRPTMPNPSHSNDSSPTGDKSDATTVSPTITTATTATTGTTGAESSSAQQEKREAWPTQHEPSQNGDTPAVPPDVSVPSALQHQQQQQPQQQRAFEGRVSDGSRNDTPLPLIALPSSGGVVLSSLTSHTLTEATPTTSTTATTGERVSGSPVGFIRTRHTQSSSHSSGAEDPAPAPHLSKNARDVETSEAAAASAAAAAATADGKRLDGADGNYHTALSSPSPSLSREGLSGAGTTTTPSVAPAATREAVPPAKAHHPPLPLFPTYPLPTDPVETSTGVGLHAGASVPTSSALPSGAAAAATVVVAHEGWLDPENTLRDSCEGSGTMLDTTSGAGCAGDGEKKAEREKKAASKEETASYTGSQPTSPTPRVVSERKDHSQTAGEGKIKSTAGTGDVPADAARSSAPSQRVEPVADPEPPTEAHANTATAAAADNNDTSPNTLNLSTVDAHPHRYGEAAAPRDASQGSTRLVRFPDPTANTTTDTHSVAEVSSSASTTAALGGRQNTSSGPSGSVSATTRNGDSFRAAGSPNATGYSISSSQTPESTSVLTAGAAGVRRSMGGSGHGQGSEDRDLIPPPLPPSSSSSRQQHTQEVGSKEPLSLAAAAADVSAGLADIRRETDLEGSSLRSPQEKSTTGFLLSDGERTAGNSKNNHPGEEGGSSGGSVDARAPRVASEGHSHMNRPEEASFSHSVANTDDGNAPEEENESGEAHLFALQLANLPMPRFYTSQMQRFVEGKSQCEQEEGEARDPSCATGGGGNSGSTTPRSGRGSTPAPLQPPPPDTDARLSPATTTHGGARRRRPSPRSDQVSEDEASSSLLARSSAEAGGKTRDLKDLHVFVDTRRSTDDFVSGTTLATMTTTTTTSTSSEPHANIPRHASGATGETAATTAAGALGGGDAGDENQARAQQHHHGQRHRGAEGSGASLLNDASASAQQTEEALRDGSTTTMMMTSESAMPPAVSVSSCSHAPSRQSEEPLHETAEADHETVRTEDADGSEERAEAEDGERKAGGEDTITVPALMLSAKQPPSPVTGDQAQAVAATGPVPEHAEAQDETLPSPVTEAYAQQRRDEDADALLALLDAKLSARPSSLSLKQSSTFYEKDAEPSPQEGGEEDAPPKEERTATPSAPRDAPPSHERASSSAHDLELNDASLLLDGEEDSKAVKTHGGNVTKGGKAAEAEDGATLMASVPVLDALAHVAAAAAAAAAPPRTLSVSLPRDDSDVTMGSAGGERGSCAAPLAAFPLVRDSSSELYCSPATASPANMSLQVADSLRAATVGAGEGLRLAARSGHIAAAAHHRRSVSAGAAVTAGGDDGGRRRSASRSDLNMASLRGDYGSPISPDPSVASPTSSASAASSASASPSSPSSLSGNASSSHLGRHHEGAAATTATGAAAAAALAGFPKLGGSPSSSSWSRPRTSRGGTTPQSKHTRANATGRPASGSSSSATHSSPSGQPQPLSEHRQGFTFQHHATPSAGNESDAPSVTVSEWSTGTPAALAVAGGHGAAFPSTGGSGGPSFATPVSAQSISPSASWRYGAPPMPHRTPSMEWLPGQGSPASSTSLTGSHAHAPPPPRKDSYRDVLERRRQHDRTLLPGEGSVTGFPLVTEALPTEEGAAADAPQSRGKDGDSVTATAANPLTSPGPPLAACREITGSSEVSWGMGDGLREDDDDGSETSIDHLVRYMEPPGEADLDARGNDHGLRGLPDPESLARLSALAVGTGSMQQMRCGGDAGERMVGGDTPLGMDAMGEGQAALSESILLVMGSALRGRQQVDSTTTLPPPPGDHHHDEDDEGNKQEDEGEESDARLPAAVASRNADTHRSGDAMPTVAPSDLAVAPPHPPSPPALAAVTKMSSGEASDSAPACSQTSAKNKTFDESDWERAMFLQTAYSVSSLGSSTERAIFGRRSLRALAMSLSQRQQQQQRRGSSGVLSGDETMSSGNDSQPATPFPAVPSSARATTAMPLERNGAPRDSSSPLPSSSASSSGAAASAEAHGPPLSSSANLVPPHTRSADNYTYYAALGSRTRYPTRVRESGDPLLASQREMGSSFFSHHGATAFGLEAASTLPRSSPPVVESTVKPPPPPLSTTTATTATMASPPRSAGERTVMTGSATRDAAPRVPGNPTARESVGVLDPFDEILYAMSKAGTGRRGATKSSYFP